MIAGGGEQMAIYHRVQEPVPVFPRHIGDEPRVLLPVEPNLLGKAALDQEIGCVLRPCTSATNTNFVVTVKVLTIDEVTVELKTGIVKDKVDTSSSLALEFFHSLPQFGKAVVEDILLGPGEMFTVCGLQLLDLLLGHIDEQRQIG